MPVNPAGSVCGPGQLVTSGQTQVLDFLINCLPPSGLGDCYDWPRHVAMHVKQPSRSAGLSPVDTPSLSERDARVPSKLIRIRSLLNREAWLLSRRDI